jgi:flagellar assembly protein FliH
MSENGKPDKKRGKGKVILGPDSTGLTEFALEELEDRYARSAWDENSESDYLERIRGKATAKARDILSKSMAEADEIKAKAFAEGKAEGLEEARTEIDAMLGERAEELATLLKNAGGGSKALWNEYRQDIVGLVRTAVEKVIGVEIERRRSEILGALLDEALENIDSHRSLAVKVHPEDASAMEELLEKAKKVHPELSKWSIRADDSLSKGGVVLESDQGMAVNSIEARVKAVDDIIGRLGLEEDDEE